MRTFGAELEQFFAIKRRDEIITPAVEPLSSPEGYETDFHSIAAEIKKKLVKVGIGITKDIKSRKDYDKLLVTNIFEYKIKGILFLPEITRWTSYKEGDELSTIKQFLQNVRRGGLLLYNTDTTVFLYLKERIKQELDSVICEQITSNKYPGKHLAVRPTSP